MNARAHVERDRLIELFDVMSSGLLADIVRTLGEDDLQLVHSAILSVLQRDEPTVKQLADRIDRSVSRTSRLVEQLVARGFVERREDETDRRLKRVRLGEPGRSFLHAMHQERADATIDLMARLTEDEQHIVVHAMELLAKAATAR